MNPDNLPRFPKQPGDIFAAPLPTGARWWQFWRPRMVYRPARCTSIETGTVYYIFIDTPNVTIGSLQP